MFVFINQFMPSVKSNQLINNGTITTSSSKMPSITKLSLEEMIKKMLTFEDGGENPNVLLALQICEVVKSKIS